MADEDTQMELPDVVVKIEPEAKEDAVVAKVETKDDPGKAAVDDLVSQYKELETRSKASDEAKIEAQRRADAAQREAEAARQEAAAARAAAASSNLDTVTTALAAAQSDAEAAKRDIRAAITNGDVDAQVDAQDRLATARALERRYDEAKADLEASKTKKSDAPVQRQTITDPIEAYVQGRSENTANWLREHKDYITDARKNAKLTAAHYDAVGEGIAPDTKEYFEHVEKVIGLRKAPDKPVTEGDDVQRHGAKKPAVRNVAPVNGSRGTGSAAGGVEVSLSAREAAAATDGTLVWNYSDPSGQNKFKKGDPIGIQELARRKVEMTKQGAYDRSYETQ